MDADPTSKHTSSKVAELLAVISASKKCSSFHTTIQIQIHLPAPQHYQSSS